MGRGMGVGAGKKREKERERERGGGGAARPPEYAIYLHLPYMGALKSLPVYHHVADYTFSSPL